MVRPPCRRAIVEELAGFGVRVHTCARGDADLQECLRRWGADGRLARVTGTACDVAARADRERLVAAAREELGGRLDILVNNAGQTMFRPATETTAEDYARIMATNLESCFHLAQPGPRRRTARRPEAPPPAGSRVRPPPGPIRRRLRPCGRSGLQHGRRARASARVRDHGGAAIPWRLCSASPVASPHRLPPSSAPPCI